MKKGFIFTVMLACVVVLGYSQSAPSGVYRFGTTSATVTFSGNSFSGSWNSTTPISGTFTVSGSSVVLNITSGPKARESWVWTIVNANTLRDQTGDRWNKEVAGGGKAGASANNSFVKNWISGEVSFFGMGVRYERMMTDKISIGANAYWTTLIIWNEIELGGSFRYYINNIFFVGAGLGFHIHTGTMEEGGYTWWGSITGAAITPEVGFKIDTGSDPGGFFVQPGLKIPVTFGMKESYWLWEDSKFGVGFGVVPYCGFGFAW
jgi:hypothetical protein